jgi:flagellar biosynthesis protein FlhG
LVNLKSDQAEGLRRILSFSRARTIAVVAANRGAGATSCVVNLGRALARQGRRVLVVDENFSNHNVAQSLGLRPRFDLKHVIGGECTVGEALLKGPGGLALLAASRAAHALPRLDSVSERRAVACFAELDDAADIVLLDVRNDAHEPSAFAAAAQEVIVVVSPGPSSITGGYSAIKRMSRTHGRKRFRMLVNRASDAQTTQLIHKNMAHAASKHLDVALEAMGAIPHDTAVSDAAHSFLPAVDASPYADASRRFVEEASAMLRWSAPHDDVSRLDTFMQRAIYGSRLFAAGAGA